MAAPRSSASDQEARLPQFTLDVARIVS